MSRYDCMLEFPAKSPLHGTASREKGREVSRVVRYYCVKTSDTGHNHLYISCITLWVPRHVGRKDERQGWYREERGG